MANTNNTQAQAAEVLGAYRASQAGWAWVDTLVMNWVANAVQNITWDRAITALLMDWSIKMADKAAAKAAKAADKAARQAAIRAVWVAARPAQAAKAAASQAAKAEARALAQAAWDDAGPSRATAKWAAALWFSQEVMIQAASLEVAAERMAAAALAHQAEVKAKAAEAKAAWLGAKATAALTAMAEAQAKATRVGNSRSWAAPSLKAGYSGADARDVDAMVRLTVKAALDATRMAERVSRNTTPSTGRLVLELAAGARRAAAAAQAVGRGNASKQDAMDGIQAQLNHIEATAKAVASHLTSDRDELAAEFSAWKEYQRDQARSFYTLWQTPVRTALTAAGIAA